MSIAVVVPSIRPEQMEKFREAWKELFEKHDVTLITVWDGEKPSLEIEYGDTNALIPDILNNEGYKRYRDLFCRYTDSCRNIGFLHAAKGPYEYILTLDDDVRPISYIESRNDREMDPIQSHLDVLSKKVCTSWVNTIDNRRHPEKPLYPRGFPYNVRDDAPVMLSHGVWYGVPDYDGETQLRLQEAGTLRSHPDYYEGPIPHGAYFPLCGMNVMIKREALPYFYFAPMGPDTGVKGLHRFGDIWMGITLKATFDKKGWACYTGGSIINHTRASDALHNMECEKLGREWTDLSFSRDTNYIDDIPYEMKEYLTLYGLKRLTYEAAIIHEMEGAAK